MAELNMNVIWMFVQAGLEIYQRHFASTGEKLTDAQVRAILQAEIDSGQHAIAVWFAEHNQPLPA